jgi:hypothetical protein
MNVGGADEAPFFMPADIRKEGETDDTGTTSTEIHGRKLTKFVKEKSYESNDIGRICA